MFKNLGLNFAIWGFILIEFGKVISVYQVAGKTIVAVDVHDDKDGIVLEQAAVKFGSAKDAVSLSGCKWWPDRKEVDLLFDKATESIEVGMPVYVVLMS